MICGEIICVDWKRERERDLTFQQLDFDQQGFVIEFLHFIQQGSQKRERGLILFCLERRKKGKKSEMLHHCRREQKIRLCSWCVVISKLAASSIMWMKVNMVIDVSLSLLCCEIKLRCCEKIDVI